MNSEETLTNHLLADVVIEARTVYALGRELDHIHSSQTATTFRDGDDRYIEHKTHVTIYYKAHNILIPANTRYYIIYDVTTAIEQNPGINYRVQLIDEDADSPND